MTRKERMKILNGKIKNCHKCEGLNIKEVTENAPGFGNIRSKVMLIGQSLCTKCMATQIPFTGGSGTILDAVFKYLHIKKKDVYITNLLHCHPPGNRPSKPEEIKRCLPYLMKEIFIVKPKLIIPLGRDAGNVVVEKLGFVYTYKNGNVCRTRPVYHPAYIYRHGDTGVTLNYIENLVNMMRKYI